MLVKESISFTRGLDPKIVLGIGQKNFRSYEDFGNFLIKIIPKLLGTDEIPKDILQEKRHVIKQAYFDIIDKFINDQKFTVKNNLIQKKCSWPWLVDNKLSELGYPTDKINESLSFERGLDPKDMLGIGGDWSPKVFKNMREFIPYLIKILPHIFGGYIPNDIINSTDGIIRNKYFHIISKYLKEHNKKFLYSGERISDDWETGDGKEFVSWPDSLKSKLLKMGYKAN